MDQMKPLTLGTGLRLALNHQSAAPSVFLLRYMTHGSFIIGERFYVDERAAREFCRARGIRVL
jgi:hypothetical protein